MTRRQMIGPVAEHVAMELRSQWGRLEMSYDALAEVAGLSKSTVIKSFKGQQAIALEVFAALTKALWVEPVKLFGEAVAAAREAETTPNTPDAVLPTPAEGYWLAARRGSSRGAALRARLDEVGRSRRTTTGGGRRE